MAQNDYSPGEVLTAGDLDDEFFWVPFRYQAGRTTGSGTFTVTFAAGRFTQAPIVVTQPKSVGALLAYEITNVPTTTGFTIERSASGTVVSHWIAIQTKSSAGAGP